MPIILLSLWLLTHFSYLVKAESGVDNLSEIDPEASELYELEEIYEFIQKNYYTQVDKKKLIQSAIKGMLSSLDNYSDMVVIDDKLTTNSDYSIGIGITTQFNTYNIEITSVIPNSPADKMGLMIGDKITKIQDFSIAELNELSIQKLLRSKDTLTLEMVRNNKKETLKLKPSNLDNNDVITSVIDNDIAYIKLLTFSPGTYQKLQSLIQDLTLKNKIKCYIIDLRDNLGGLLNEAIQTAGLFLNQGEVIKKIGQNATYYKSETVRIGDITKGKPILIITNKYTASSAEVFVAGLKDNNRALVVGEKTYGKGLTQTKFKLNNNDKKYLYLTTSELVRINDEKIQGVGITPDFTFYNQDLLSNNTYSISKNYIQRLSNTSEDIKNYTNYSTNTNLSWGEINAVRKKDFQLAFAIYITNTLVRPKLSANLETVYEEALLTIK